MSPLLVTILMTSVVLMTAFGNECERMAQKCNIASQKCQVSLANLRKMQEKTTANLTDLTFVFDRAETSSRNKIEKLESVERNFTAHVEKCESAILDLRKQLDNFDNGLSREQREMTRYAAILKKVAEDKKKLKLAKKLFQEYKMSSGDSWLDTVNKTIQAHKEKQLCRGYLKECDMQATECGMKLEKIESQIQQNNQQLEEKSAQLVKEIEEQKDIKSLNNEFDKCRLLEKSQRIKLLESKRKVDDIEEKLNEYQKNNKKSATAMTLIKMIKEGGVTYQRPDINPVFALADRTEPLKSNQENDQIFVRAYERKNPIPEKGRTSDQEHDEFMFAREDSTKLMQETVPTSNQEHGSTSKLEDLKTGTLLKVAIKLAKVMQEFVNALKKMVS